jgi:hypothetical protein
MSHILDLAIDFRFVIVYFADEVPEKDVVVAQKMSIDIVEEFESIMNDIKKKDNYQVGQADIHNGNDGNVRKGNDCVRLEETAETNSIQINENDSSVAQENKGTSSAFHVKIEEKYIIVIVSRDVEVEENKCSIDMKIQCTVGALSEGTGCAILETEGVSAKYEDGGTYGDDNSDGDDNGDGDDSSDDEDNAINVEISDCIFICVF